MMTNKVKNQRVQSVMHKTIEEHPCSVLLFSGPNPEIKDKLSIGYVAHNIGLVDVPPIVNAFAHFMEKTVDRSVDHIETGCLVLDAFNAVSIRLVAAMKDEPHSEQVKALVYELEMLAAAGVTKETPKPEVPGDATS